MPKALKANELKTDIVIGQLPAGDESKRRRPRRRAKLPTSNLTRPPRLTWDCCACLRDSRIRAANPYREPECCICHNHERCERCGRFWGIGELQPGEDSIGVGSLQLPAPADEASEAGDQRREVRNLGSSGNAVGSGRW
jgi:hypothetical protein